MIYSSYYNFKPLLPRRLHLLLRRALAQRKLNRFKDVWPIYETESRPPRGWKGWPGDKRFALLLTHDVDTARGHATCHKLMNLEKSLGFTSSFFFVPEAYEIDYRMFEQLRLNGFEVGVHGLKHDGKLFKSKKFFLSRAERINTYLSAWKATGFRSPCMHHQLEWMQALHIDYDASTYDIDPFEPQGGGVRTTFPFVVQGENGNSFVELPYTLPQDHLLFIILQERTIDLWKRKLDWIVDKGGMAHVIVHPDYMYFNDSARCYAESYPAALYRELLEYITVKYQGQYCNMTAKDVAAFWMTEMN